jgi:hypothetical protein
MIFYIHLFCHDFRKMNGRIKIFEKCMPYRHSFRRVGAEREEGVPGGGRSTGGPASPGDPRALTVRSSIAVARLLISCSGFLRWNFVWNFLMGSESPPPLFLIRASLAMLAPGSTSCKSGSRVSTSCRFW